MHTVQTSKERCNVEEEISESKNGKKASSKLQSLPFILSCCLHAWSRPLSVASIVADAGGGGGEHSEGVSQSSSGTIFTSLYSYRRAPAQVALPTESVLHCPKESYKRDLCQLKKIPMHLR